MWAAHVGSTAQPGGVSIPGLDSSDLDLANLPTSGCLTQKRLKALLVENGSPEFYVLLAVNRFGH